MIKKGILATDFSQASGLLIQCSNIYKDLGIEKITLFHALGVEYMNFYGYVGLENTKKKLEETRLSLTDKGFEVDVVIKEGLPYFELEAYAEEHPDSIIILGTKGKGFLKGLVLGSTVNHILKAANLPVLVVQCNEIPEETDTFTPMLSCKTSTHHVLMPTDFSAYAGKAFDFMLENIAPFTKKISLLHVQDKEVMKYREESKIETFNHEDSTRLEGMSKKLSAKTDATIHTKISTGNPTVEILQYIKDEDCSLVVMGKQGKGYIANYILGSVTRRVIEESGVNCLIVPNP